MTIKKSYDKQLTQTIVWDAIHHFISQGERPTERGLRDYLGRGSITTINRMIGQWFEHHGPTLAGNDRLIESEDDRILREAMAGVIQIVKKAAQDELASQHAELSARHEEVKRLADEAQGIIESNKALERELASATALRNSLQDQCDALRRSEHTLTERTSHLEIHLQHEREAASRSEAALRKMEEQAARNQKLSESLKKDLHALKIETERQQSNLKDSAARLEAQTAKINTLEAQLQSAKHEAQIATREIAAERAKSTELATRLAESEAGQERARTEHAKALADERARLDHQIALLAKNTSAPKSRVRSRKKD